MSSGEQSRVRAVLHRFHVLINPLFWLAGGAAPEHRAEFLSAVDLATGEVAERSEEPEHGDDAPDP